jgi:hypothetical protein
VSTTRRGPRPHGLGVAVVFDWSLGVQLTVQAVAAASGQLGLSGNPASVAGRLAAAVLMVGLGEGLRRGVPAVRLAQVVIMVLISVLGVASLVLLVRTHDRSLILSTIIELTYAPWLAWRLMDSDTVAWFRASRGRGRAPRTSGATWVAALVAWSVVWGSAVAWSQSLS